MNIASAFLLGTKIKDTEYPDEPWTKMTTFPNNTGTNVQKTGIAYKGNIYATFGQEGVAQRQTATFTVKKFDGTSWSDAVTLTTPAYEYNNWTFDKSSMLFFVYNGKLYISGARPVNQPKFGYIFDGTTWSNWTIPIGNISQVVEKNGKLYLFELHQRGSWNVGYWWDVYEYNDLSGTATLVAQNVADSQINSGLSDGSTVVVNLNGTLHCMGGIADTNTCKHGIINDDWSYTAKNHMYPTASNLIVYKNKIHGFGTGEIWSPYVKTHITWESVNDVWEVAPETPYFSPNNDRYFIPKPIIYKNKLWLLGAGKSSGYSDTYNSKFDDIYRYNK